MKKFVKIISVVMCALLLVTGFFFAPKNMTPFLLSSHAATTSVDSSSNGLTYDYDAELKLDYYGLGDFAIENISSFMYSDGFYFKFSCLVPSAYQYIFGLVSSDYFTQARYFDYFIVNNTGFNMCVVCRSGSIAFESKTAITYNGSSYYALNAFNMSANTQLDFYFSNYNFSVDSGKNVSFADSLSISSGVIYQPDFTSIVDMNSQTEFNYQTSYYNSSGYGNEFFYDLFSALYNKTTTSDLSFGSYAFNNTEDISCFSSRNGTVSNYNVFAYYSFYVRGYLVGSFDASSVLNFLRFEILRPSYRVNNSLIFFNYDYLKSFSSCEEISYTLRKNNDLYNVNYLGSVPNSKYVQISSEEVNNIIFDEYISLKLNFNPLMESISDSYYVVDDFVVFENSLGFDFNFSYYVEPLVSNNSSYNYEFDKPSYRDASIEFSVVPPELHIPFLAWIENAFIFLLFYCPITSDIIELLHFDKFLGGLIAIFDMFLDSQVGEFVLGCFAFFVLWSFLKSLLPSIVSSIRSRSSSSNDSMSSYYQQQSDNFMKALNYKPGRVRSFKWKYSNYNRAQNLKTTYKGFKGKRSSRLRSSFVRMEKSRLQQKGKIRSE